MNRLRTKCSDNGSDIVKVKQNNDSWEQSFPWDDWEW